MEKLRSASQTIYLAVIAIFGWFALIAQLYININSNAASTPEIIIRYFSYFTITTNLIVALCCTRVLFKQSSFFNKQTTLTALTVYILIVGIIYNTMLRSLWKPEGLQMLVDEVLHSVIPVLFLVYWLLFVEKDQLSSKAILPWLIYPLLYTIFILFRGSFSGFYPYPFINIAELGFQKVMVNALGIALAFIAVSLLFVGFSNLRKISNNSSF